MSSICSIARVGISGEIPDLPIEVPADVVHWRMKQRPNELARLFLKRAHSVEEHIAIVKDGAIVPGFCLARNVTG